MTRPKRTRQAEKQKKNNPFAHLPVLAQARVPLSPKYAVEITLHDLEYACPISCIWDPRLPTPAEMEALRERLEEELAVFQMLGLRLKGLLTAGEAGDAS